MSLLGFIGRRQDWKSAGWLVISDGVDGAPKSGDSRRLFGGAWVGIWMLEGEAVMGVLELGGFPRGPGNAGWKVERVEGIEPSTKAWEAFVLPLNYTRFGVIQCVLRAVLSKNPRYQLGKLE